MVSTTSSNSAPSTIPPLSPYGTFQGTLFQYSSNLVAFESSPRLEEGPSPKKCILIGGLSDGLIPTPYTKQLEEACHDIGWSFVQPLISSSYTGFGHGSLDRDTEELNSLMEYLCFHRSAETFALVGHSTGCQNSVHFLKHGNQKMIEKTKLVVLQAPVSDREGAMLEPNYKENIQHARSLLDNGKSEEMMPRDAFWAPITAKRFLSLQDLKGDDDFFSSDLTDEEMHDRLSHVEKVGSQSGLKLIAAFSAKDEYVPEHVDVHRLSERLCEAMNGSIINGKSNNDSDKDSIVASKLILENGNHNLSQGQNDAVTFVQAVKDKLKMLN